MVVVQAGQQDADANILLNSGDGSRGQHPGQAGHYDPDHKTLSNSQAEIEGRRPGHSDADANILYNSPSKNLNIAKCD